MILLSVPGIVEILVILAVIILFFGTKRIPGLGKGLGKSVKEFKDAKDGKEDDIAK